MSWEFVCGCGEAGKKGWENQISKYLEEFTKKAKRIAGSAECPFEVDDNEI